MLQFNNNEHPIVNNQLFNVICHERLIVKTHLKLKKFVSSLNVKKPIENMP